MKSLRTLPFLALLALPLGAQELRDPQPMFIEIRIDAPLSGLKDAVGNHPAINANVGYVFHSDARGHFTMAFRLDADEFQDTTTHRGAQGVGFGPEISVFFRPGFQGFFMNAGFTVSDWSLTKRDDGTLQDQHYTRAGASLAFGYRFKKNWSLEAVYKSVNIDQDLHLDSVGLGLRMNF
jgi:hypothetical protein